MELFFLFLLIFLMAFALASGYPLAFALPGSAIISILLAGLAGYLFEGNANEYFVSDGPFQWLNAGITNFRGVYWEVERDTLIAIPLFIFMGILAQLIIVQQNNFKKDNDNSDQKILFDK